MSTPVDRGLLAGYSPLLDPYVGTASVGTTSALLGPDHPGNLLHNVRRLRIYNTHATQILGVVLVARGTDPATGVMAGAVWIPPGQVWSSIIDGTRRLLVVASGAGTPFNYMVDDV